VNPEPELVAHLGRLEEDFLRPEVRRSRAALEELLAPDFTEVGASGRTWDRATIVAALADEEPATVRIENFAVRLLGPDVALATYRSVREHPAGRRPSIALRSSIWRREDDGPWRLTHHQGTPTA
jgi:hypothetical protein